MAVIVCTLVAIVLVVLAEIAADCFDLLVVPAILAIFAIVLFFPCLVWCLTMSARLVTQLAFSILQS